MKIVLHLFALAILLTSALAFQGWDMALQSASPAVYSTLEDESVYLGNKCETNDDCETSTYCCSKGRCVMGQICYKGQK
jgi:hypothetical protein